MKAILPLIVMAAIIFRHQRRKGRPSWLAYALAAYLWAVVIWKAPWIFDYLNF